MRYAYVISSLILVPLMFVSACTMPKSKDGPIEALAKPELHELPYDEVPQWELVSLKGLDDALRRAYEAKNYSGIYGVDNPIVFDGLDYADFSEVAGKLRIHIARNSKDFMAIAFSSCNGIRGTYERDGDAWRYVGPSRTAISCERVVRDKSGKQVLLSTPMIVDNWFMRIAPDVKNYYVSANGKTLNLLGANAEELGVFTLAEVAK